MTNEEAREILQQIRKQKCVTECDYSCKLYESEKFCLEEKALDTAIKALEQQPKMQDCEHCIHTYGTLGCCDMVNNEWVYDCEFGKEQYKKEHESQPCEDAISREEALKVMCDNCPMYNCITGCSSYRHIEKMPSVTPKAESEE